MKRPKIAIIENDLNMLAALTRLLSVHGFPVAGFRSAEAFIESDGASEASCLVLDIHLDGISGLELGRRLLQAGHQLPIIFMTASGASEAKEQAQEVGSVAYLLKPFASADLIDAINEAAAY